MNNNNDRNKPRWFFGGVSSTLAICFTHPLELLKVQLQVQQSNKPSFLQLGKQAIKHHGVRGVFKGLDANIVRHSTATTCRLGFYDMYKNEYCDSKRLTTVQNTIASSLSGILGGVVGNPIDVVKVRMQNDMKLPTEMRRNYKNIFDGLIKIIKQEGVSTLFRGLNMSCLKGGLFTLGQLAGYDECKYQLEKYEVFNDGIHTHIASAFGAGIALLVLVQPLDVIQTRLMNGFHNQYTNTFSCIKEIFSVGPQGFYKGIVPSFIRIMPYNILLFVIKEKLTEFFGTKDC